MRPVFRWCIILAFVLNETIEAIVIKKGEESDPSYVSYQSDGWSTWVAKRHARRVDGLQVACTGRSKQELLMERAVYKSISPTGEISGAIRLQPARIMSEGKACWNVFQAACESCPMLRHSGHEGFSASHYMQDGLFADEFLLHQKARHKYYFQVAEFPDADARHKSESMDLVFGGTCKLHVAGRAIKWAMAGCTTEEVVKDIHIGIKSLLNTSSELRDHIDQFITRHVSFIVTGVKPWSRRIKYWRALGVDPAMLEVLALVNPRWDPTTKTLSVEPSLLTNPDGMGKLKQVLLYGTRWVNFADTRFAGIGPCSRAWLIGESLGCNGLVDVTLEDKRVQNYHLKGYGRLNGACRHWLGVSSLAFYPVEGMAGSLLEDDRFLQRAPELWQDMITEMEWLSELPVQVFAEIARVTGLASTGEHLRSEILMSMHLSVGFVAKECYDELTQLPLSLTQGDIRAKVLELQQLRPSQRV